MNKDNILCFCGCNKYFNKYDSRGRIRKYIHGHNNKGEKHWNWRGDNVKYGGLHDYIVLRLGEPKKCDICKSDKKKKYEWANKDHKYRRILSDWFRVCTSCHRKWDILHNNYRKNSK